MKNRYSSYIILGIYFVIGIMFGYLLPKKHSQKPNQITFDLLKENNKILIYGHYSGNLIFEYSKIKPADSSAYREFEEVWEEVMGSGQTRWIICKFLNFF